MAIFFIIHGAYGNSKDNWIPWLKKQLEKQNHHVIVPAFPTPDGQSLDAWINVADEEIKKLTEIKKLAEKKIKIKKLAEKINNYIFLK